VVDTAATRTADFLLDPAARLAGRVVVRSSNEPVPEATVVLSDEQVWWRSPRQARSDSEGRFELRDLDAGHYQLAAHKGRLVGSLAVDIAAATRTAEATLPVDQGMVVSGRVAERRSDGPPVAGATIRVSDRPFGAGGRTRATTGSDGRFQIEGVLPGGLTVTAEARGHAPALREVVVAAGHDASGVDLVLAPEATVVGRVLSREEGPIAGATVTALVSQGGDLRAGASATDRTDQTGGFRLVGLAAGQVRVEAEAPERGRASFGPSPLGAGETRTITLTLEPGATVSGTVSYEDGTPAPGATVMATVLAQPSVNQTRAGTDGSYRLGPLPAGQVMIVASRKEGYGGLLQMDMSRAARASQQVELAANERRRGVNLVVEKGGHKVTGQVLGTDGKPLAGASVRAERNEAMAGLRSAMAAMLGDDKVVSDQDGRFTIDDLSAGPYLLVARSAGLPDARVPRVPTDAREVRIQFQPGATLGGVVVDGTGQPVADYSVRAVEAAAAGSSDGATTRMVQGMASMFGGAGGVSVHDASGAFELRSLAAGKYDVLATTADGRLARLSAVTVAAGERKTGLRLMLKSGITVHGKVVELGPETPVTGLPVVVMDEQRPQFTSSGQDGTFRLQGLSPGRGVQVSVGGPMAAFIPDRYEVTLSEGKGEVDLGILRVVRGPARRGDNRTGLAVQVQDGRASIRVVRDGSPAAEAGVKKGAILSAIDGHELTGLGTAGVGQLLSGEVGSPVQLTLAASADQPPRTVTLVRKEAGARAPETH
jgi:protocatechuate 3,4-dioxygenase beta subunit